MTLTLETAHNRAEAALSLCSPQIGAMPYPFTDANGRQTLRQFANGDCTSFAYDNLGRQTSRWYADNTRFSTVYDSVGNTVTMADSTGATTYAYDPNNRLTGKTDPGGLSQGYGYDIAGQRTKLVDPDGGVRSMTFDLDSRMSTTVLPNGTANSYLYDSAGRMTTLLQTNPTLNRLWSYDAAGQIVVAHRVEGANTYGATYLYDPVGNRQVIQDLNGSATTYLMDAKNRLIQDATSGTNAHTYNYSFDSNDNILTNSESGVLATNTYDIANRLTTSIAGSALTSYTFDLNGNQTVVNVAGVLTSMSYDKENRLSVYLSPSSSVSYTYSGDMLKRCEWVSGMPTTLIWDGQNYLEGRN